LPDFSKISSPHLDLEHRALWYILIIIKQY